MYKYFVKSKEIFLRLKSVSFSFKGLAVAVSAGGLIVIFQNCAGGFNVADNAYSSLSSSGLDFCRQNPTAPECVNVAAAECKFNGQTLSNGQTIKAYLNSTVPAGQSCESQVRSCQNGVLSGNYNYASCAVAAPAACLFNGQTIASGQSVTAFLASSASGACTQESRVCNNGALSGSYTFATCSIVVPAPAPASTAENQDAIPKATDKTCALNGITLASGSKITAYANATAAMGEACVAEIRSCNNGTLSGSYTNISCTQPTTSCSFNGQAVVHGASVVAYPASTVATGGKCVSTTRTCFNGVLSGTANYASCEVNKPASCLFNTNQTVPHGQSVTAYVSAAPAVGVACSSQVRKCNNGTLSGSNTFATCTATIAPQSTPKNCTLNGVVIQNGGSLTAYSSEIASEGGLCLQQTRVCTNGVLSGTYTKSSCTVPKNTCSFDGKTVAHGASINAYATSTVPAGSTCELTKRTCNNGVLSASGDYASCSVDKPASCLFNTKTVAHSQGVIAYSTASGNCSSETRVCTNGVLSGSNTFATCTQVMAACTFDGQTVDHGASVNAYATSAVGFGKTCTAIKRTCYNGSLSGSGDYKSCVTDKPASCLFNTQTVAHSEKVSAYASSTVAYGQSCTAVSRTCNNGVLSGSGDFANCAAGQPASCLVGNQTIPHSGSANFYSSDQGTMTVACKSVKRTCTNGVLSGSGTATSCEEFNAGSCTPVKCDKWISQAGEFWLSAGSAVIFDTDDSSKFVGRRYCISQDIDFGSQKISSPLLLDRVAVNGCGFKFNNMNINRNDGGDVGLFTGTTVLIENLTLNAPKVNAGWGQSSGILFSKLSTATVRNIKIENMVSPSIQSKWSVFSCGGVIGSATDVTLNDISISGDVFSLSGCDNLGGVVGYLDNSYQSHPRTIKNISVKFDEMDFDKFDMAGGFVGMLKDSSEGPSNINVAGDMFFGDGMDCRTKPGDASQITNCNSAGGIIGQLSGINLSPYSLSGLNYTGRIYSWGLEYSGVYHSGTGGLIGSLYNNNSLKLSLVNSSVAGQVNVMGSPTSVDPANLFGGSVVGGNFISSPIVHKDLKLNVTLKVNGEVSNKTVGVDPDSKADSCHINGEAIAANTTVKRFLTSAVGTNQPADAAVYFQCNIEAINVHNLSPKKSLKLNADNANVNLSNFSSSGYSADAGVSWLSHPLIKSSESFTSAYKKVSNNKQLGSFAGWLYANSTVDPSAPLSSVSQLLSSVTNAPSTWTAPESNASSFIDRHPSATQESFSTVVALPPPAAPIGGTGSTPTTPTTAPLSILSTPRAYSADGYLWNESYPEGKWSNVAISSDKKSIVISNAPNYSYDDTNYKNYYKFYVTTDSGKTWKPTVSAAPKNLINSSSNDGKVILRMKHAQSSVSLSKDSGSTWSNLSTLSKKIIAGGVTGNGSKIYLSSADGNVLSSVDDGKTWKTFKVVVDPNKPNNPSNVTDASNTYNPNFIHFGHLVTFDDDNRVLHVSYYGSFVSTDGGTIWHRNLNELNYDTKLFKSKDKKTIITSMWYPQQIVISKDSGQSFRGISSEIMTSASISDDGSKIVLMTPGNLYLSTDGGSSFKKLNEKYGGMSWTELAASSDVNTIAAVQDNRVIIGVKSAEQVAYTLSGYDFAIKNAFPYLSAAGVDTIAMSYDGTKMMATISDSGGARNPDNNNVRYFGPATMASGNKGVSWSPIGSDSCVNNSYIDTLGVRQWTPCGVTYSTYGHYIEMSYDGSRAISINQTSVATAGGINVPSGMGLGGGVNFPLRDGSEMLYVTGMAMSSDAQKIIAFTSQGLYYTTTNGGVNWTKRSTSNIMTAHAHLKWDISAAMSADGNLIVVYTSLNGKYLKSTDGGVKWTEIKSPSSAPYTSSYNVRLSIAKSGGQYIITTSFYDGKIYQSKDSGATWKALNIAGTVDTFSTSADGKVIAVGMRDSYVYLSKDGAATFTEQTKAGRNKWSAIKVSPDGKILAVGSRAPNAYVQVADISAATPGETSVPAVPVPPSAPPPPPAPVQTTPTPQSCEAVSPTCASGTAIWDSTNGCQCTTPANTDSYG